MEFEILINNLIKAIEENRACTEVKFEKNNNVNDKIRMYKKWKIKMYKKDRFYFL